MFPLYDVVPRRTTPWVTIAALTVIVAATAAQALSPIGVLALVANAIAWWLFAPAVEDRAGHARFAFLIAPLFALLGTAGTVAAIIGAYVVLFRHSLVLVLLPIPLRVIEVPSPFAAAAWLIVQMLVLGPRLWTCAAGFAIGAAAILVLRRRERMRVEWWERGGRL